MLKIILILSLIIICSCDREQDSEKDRADFWIEDLQIPSEFKGDGEIVLKGKGFKTNCNLFLQLNGSTETKVSIVSVTDSTLIFNVSGMQPGFYFIWLEQDGQKQRIGAINLRTEKLQPDEIEAYGIYGQTTLDIRPISISKRVVGQPIVTIPADYEFGAVAVENNQRFYYSYFSIEMITNPDGSNSMKPFYKIAYYDINTSESAEVKWTNVKNYFAMGIINQKLHVLITTDNRTYSLMALTKSGEEQLITTFDFSSLGATPIWENDGAFNYHQESQTLLIEGTMGVGVDVRKVALALSVNDKKIYDNGKNSSVSYSSVVANDVIYYYCRYEQNDLFTTSVLRINNPFDWNFSDQSLHEFEIERSALQNPVFDTSKQLIYAVEEEGDVVRYNIQTHTIEGGKWIKAGLSSIFIL